MENVFVKMFPMCGLSLPRAISMRQCISEKYYSTNVRNIMKKTKHLHPYRKIHPWKSVEAFSKSLVDGVIYNEDGLVVINKPYGISGKDNQQTKESGDKKSPFSKHEKPSSGIVKEVNYTLSDAIPYIAEKLGYSSLKLINTPERFTSGITILAADAAVENAVDKSLRKAQGMRLVPKTYWAVTTRMPNEMKGEKRLAMKMKQNPDGRGRVPMIIESWTHNEQKRREVKILNVQFKVISNSTDNLSSLIEIKSSTKKWHAIRLFASTVLYSPILGDNIYGSRIQNVMGKWMNISPFVEASQGPPRLDKDLLKILRISPGNEPMIPAHLHLRELYLPMYIKRNNNLLLTAPPMPEFMWTAQQLKFKHELFKITEDDEESTNEHPESVQFQAVT